MKIFFLVLMSAGLVFAQNAKKTEKKHEHREEVAHNHGAAEVSAVFDGLNGRIELSIPSLAVFGFEHRPKNDKDQKKTDEGLAKIDGKISEMLVFDKSLNCQFTKDRVQVSYEGGEEVEDAKKRKVKTAEHSDTMAVFNVVCEKPVTGTDLIFNFHTHFSKIKSLNVQIVADGVQKSMTVKKSKTIFSLKN